MTPILLFLMLMLSALYCCNSDEGVYDDTEAIEQSHSHLSSFSTDLTFTIRTSHTYLAGTTDIILATIIGDFSSSGPHGIGSFEVGSSATRDITLDRKVGKIQRLLFANNGTNGWLPSYVACDYYGESYEFDVPRHWLSTHQTEALIEPDTQLLHEIQTFPIMSLPVSGIVRNIPEI